MTNRRIENIDFWSSDAQEIGRALSDYVQSIISSPERTDFNQLISLAEDAMEFGFVALAAEILNVGRTALLTAEIPQTPEIDARLLNVEGLLALRTGRIHEAIEILRSASERNRTVGDPIGTALAEQNLADALWMSGDLRGARERARVALDIYTNEGDKFRCAQMLVNLANLDLEEGKLQDAKRRLDEAQSFARIRSAASVRISILGTRGLIARAEGDQELAGIIHRQVLKRTRRSGSLFQRRTATQNLASWYSEMDQPGRAALLFGRAAQLASQEGDRKVAARLLRAQASQLFTAHNLRQAILVMRDAVAISDEVLDDQGSAEGRADLGAFLVDLSFHGSKRLKEDDGQGHSALLAEADSLLTGSLSYFRQIGDAAWTERVLANSASLALIRGDPLEALRLLVEAKQSVANNPELCKSLDRRAAYIALNDARRPDLAAYFVRQGAYTAAAVDDEAIALPVSSQSPEPTVRSGSARSAWELAVGAARFRDRAFALHSAVELLREAQGLAEGDDALLFHITNELGTTFDQLNEPTLAIQCFELCLTIAERFNDRVMRQLALGNRAEMAQRQGEPGALGALREAAQLAADLGDISAEAGAIMNLATAYVDDATYGEAESLVERAQRLVELAGSSSDEQTRLLWIRGNIAAGREDFDTARSHYLAAADISVGVDRIASLASALWTYARSGQRQAYKRLLQRIVRLAQRQGLDGAAAVEILSSAEAWLTAGVPKWSAETYGVAVELSLVEWMNTIPIVTDTPGEVPLELSDSPTDLSEYASILIRVISTMISTLAQRSTLRNQVIQSVISKIRHDLPEQVGEMAARMLNESLADAQNDAI